MKLQACKCGGREGAGFPAVRGSVAPIKTYDRSVLKSILQASEQIVEADEGTVVLVRLRERGNIGELRWHRAIRAGQ